jgi:hypothetical protein
MLVLRAWLLAGALVLIASARRYYRRAFGEVESEALFAVPVPELESLSIFSPSGSTPLLAGSRTGSPVARRFVLALGSALALYLILLLRAVSPPLGIDVDESLVQPPWQALHSGLAISMQAPGGPVYMSLSTVKALYGQILYALYALYGSFLLGLWLWRERRLGHCYLLALGASLLGLSVIGATLGSIYPGVGGSFWIVAFVAPAVLHLWLALLLCGGSMILAGLLDHWQLVRTLGRPAGRREEERG